MTPLPNLKSSLVAIIKHPVTTYSMIGFLSLVIIITTVVMTFRLRHRNQPFVYGVSFSPVYAEELGLDWRQTYQALLNDLDFKNLRLVSYWDRYQPEPERFDFTDLDWQFEEAKQRNAKISLAIGLRQPRWPECREPQWATQLQGEQWLEALMRYISEVVKRYKAHPSLASWQLENEFFNRDFGKACRNFDRGRLSSEYNLVKNLDADHPIIMAQSNQVGIPLLRPHPDIYGFSVYKRIFEARLLKRYITHPVPAWFHSLRAQMIELLHRRPVIIHELQAEPWTRGGLVSTYDDKEQQQTMSLTQLERNISFAQKTGIKTMYFWGGEWWYWRKTKLNDAGYWQLIDRTLKINR